MQKLTTEMLAKVSPLDPVELQPLSRPGDTEIHRQAVVLDPDGINQVVGIVGPDYRLITNRSARDIALDILTRTGRPFTEISTAFNGKQWRTRWIFDDMNLEPKPGDFVALGIDAVNSYDGSTQHSLSYIALRRVCVNGMNIDFLLGGFRFRHLGNDDKWELELEAAVSELTNLGRNADVVLPAMTNMVNSRVDVVGLRKLARQADPSGLITAKALFESEGDTAWDVYNGYTRVLSAQNTIAADNRNRDISRVFFKEYASGHN